MWRNYATTYEAPVRRPWWRRKPYWWVRLRDRLQPKRWSIPAFLEKQTDD